MINGLLSYLLCTLNSLPAFKVYVKLFIALSTALYLKRSTLDFVKFTMVQPFD